MSDIEERSRDLLAAFLSSDARLREMWGNGALLMNDCHSLRISPSEIREALRHALPAMLGRRIRVEMRKASESKFIFKRESDLGMLDLLLGDGWSFHSPSINLAYDLFPEFCRLESSLTKITRLPVSGVSVFVTPAQSIALPPHHDDEDVFSFQMFGSKTWDVFDVVPTRFRVKEPEPANFASLSTSVLLQPGDVAYIPRGMVHSVRSGKEPSVSLCIAYRGDDWADLAGRALTERLRDVPSLMSTKHLLGGGEVSLTEINKHALICAEVLSALLQEETRSILIKFFSNELVERR